MCSLAAAKACSDNIFLDTAMEMGIEAAHQVMRDARNLKHIGSIRMEKELLEVNALTAT